MRKKYDSFKEVNEDLKILKLQKEIDKEKFILNYNRTKQDLELSPMKAVRGAVGNVVSNAASSIAKQGILVKLISKVFKKK